MTVQEYMQQAEDAAGAGIPVDWRQVAITIMQTTIAKIGELEQEVAKGLVSTEEKGEVEYDRQSNASD